IAIQYLAADKVPFMWDPPSDIVPAHVDDFARKLRHSGQLELLRLPSQNNFFLTVIACDWLDASRGDERALWQTRALAPSRPVPIDVALARMIHAMSPHLQQET